MSQENKYYITTAIDYVNGPPHIGHALEKVQADVVARYQRLLGKDVFFLTGTDEHGVKNVRAAQEAGVSVSTFVDGNVAKFQQLAKELNISNDAFIRTTDKRRHWPSAVKMWKKLEQAGGIYKKEYEGLYCVGHEAFVTQKDLVDGMCAIHRKEPEVIREENYFFGLSKYAEHIVRAIESGALRIVPEQSKNEVLRFLEDGLEDVSFSRPRKDLSWGIPVPGDEEQTMYVWADALTNYLSAIEYGKDEHTETATFKKYWPADLHIIGKDIIRFHALIWPGMLIAAGLPLPHMLLAHGFISVGGAKMSKTVGNVVDPLAYTERYGADALRYYLLREIPTTRDGDFTDEKFRERYRGDLARGIGNLVARITALGEEHVKGTLPAVRSDALDEMLDDHWARYHTAFLNFQFDEALRITWSVISHGDKMVDSTKLWELPNKNPARFYEVMGELGVLIATVAHMVQQFMPETSEKIFAQLGIDPNSEDEWEFTIKKGEALFPRIE